MGYAPVTKFGSYKDLFWNAKVGEIIGPVEIQSVYGIFRLLGKVDGKPIDFNNIKSEVIKACQFENETDILRDYLNKLRSKVEVNINNDLLDSDAIEK
jgi:parvulin-like peptidyl-prolyl isomerase